MTIHIGAHPSNLTSTALAHEPSLQAALRAAHPDIAFSWYEDGKSAADALDRGDINVVGTGSTRALASQANGIALSYIAASKPRSAGAAILVRNTSKIWSVADLTDKRVGFIEGSFHTYFLVAALDAADLGYEAVVATNWPVKDSQRALLADEMDAWVASAPYLGPALQTGKLRALVGCDALIPNRSVFWIRKEVERLGRPVVESIARSFAEADRWITADPKRAGELFAKTIGGVTSEAWLESVLGRKWGLLPVGDEILREQQTEADLLARQSLLAGRIDLREAALPYELAIG